MYWTSFLVFKLKIIPCLMRSESLMTFQIPRKLDLINNEIVFSVRKHFNPLSVQWTHLFCFHIICTMTLIFDKVCFDIKHTIQLFSFIQFIRECLLWIPLFSSKSIYWIEKKIGHNRKKHQKIISMSAQWCLVSSLKEFFFIDHRVNSSEVIQNRI